MDNRIRVNWKLENDFRSIGFSVAIEGLKNIYMLEKHTINLFFIDHKLSFFKQILYIPHTTQYQTLFDR